MTSANCVDVKGIVRHVVIVCELRFGGGWRRPYLAGGLVCLAVVWIACSMDVVVGKMMRIVNSVCLILGHVVAVVSGGRRALDCLVVV